jgi:hypothetical protein
MAWRHVDNHGSETKIQFLGMELRWAKQFPMDQHSELKLL